MKRTIPKEIVNTKAGERLVMFDPPGRRWREYVRDSNSYNGWSNTLLWARSKKALIAKINATA